MSSEGATCNIDLKGRRHRTKIYRAAFQGALVLSGANAMLPFFGVTDLRVLWALWAMIYLTFCAFTVTREEVVSNVCIVVGALGKEETSGMQWKPIVDARRVAALRMKSIMIVLKGSLMGSVFAAIAISAPYLRLGGPYFLTVKLPMSV